MKYLFGSIKVRACIIEDKPEQVQALPPAPEPDDPIDWADKRVAPHWSLLAAALVIWAFLLDQIRPYLSPLTMSLAILILLYPSRRTRAIKPLLFLAFVAAVIALWWRLHSLLMPFLIAFLLAYAFDPIVEWASRKGLPRLIAVLILVIVLLGLIVTAGLLVLPMLVDEVSVLAGAIPKWIELMKEFVVYDLVPWAARVNVPTDRIWEELQPRLPGMVKNLMGGLAEWGAKAVSGLLGLATGIANLILIPILTIYFLNDYRRIRSWIYRAFPKDYRADALEAYTRLNLAMSAFIRGQLVVCLFLAIWIGAGLMLFAHLPYAILLGAAAGILNLIPYVGTTFALIVTLAVAMFQPAPIATALKSLVVFVSAQTLEGNLLTPRIVGDRVGLHPLVVIFTVLLFATLFGIIGMLVAIPVAASAKVLWEVWDRRRQRLSGILPSPDINA